MLNPSKVGKRDISTPPHSLWSAAARLKEAGHEVHLFDENLRPYDGESSVVGVNLLGAPYIPEVQKLQARFKEKSTWILGGQAMTPTFGINRAQQTQLFGENTVNGNEPNALRNFLEQKSPLADPDELSLIPIYEQVPDADFKEYLEHEMSFHLSQGCREKCTFCTAAKNQPEHYRQEDILEKDINYLVERAIRLGIHELNLYVSNLDLFQSPEQLRQWIEILQKLRGKHPDFKIKWRGLSTIQSFNSNADSDLLSSLLKVGLQRVGFGFDGAREEVWKSTNKRQNLTDCLRAAKTCSRAEITPEALMVFGHPNETKDSLEEAVRLSLFVHKEFGAIPRPHVAKGVYPGNQAWILRRTHPIREVLMEGPESFQALDFTALASTVSHPDPEARALVNESFRAICDIPGNLTQVIYPLAPEKKDLWETYKVLNYGKFDL